MWELALLLVGVTYLMVNTVCMVIYVKMMTDMKGVWKKSLAYIEKMMDKTSELFEEE